MSETILKFGNELHNPNLIEKLKYKKELYSSKKWHFFNGKVVQGQDLRIIYTVDKNGVGRYSFAYILDNTHCVILRNKEIVPTLPIKDNSMKRFDNVCCGYYRNGGVDSGFLYQSLDLRDIFYQYHCSPNLVVMNLHRNKTNQEKKIDKKNREILHKTYKNGPDFFEQANKNGCLRKNHKEKLIINDEKHIIDSLFNKHGYINVNELLVFEDAIFDILQSGKKYPEKYKEEIFETRKQLVKTIKNNILGADVLRDDLIF